MRTPQAEEHNADENDPEDSHGIHLPWGVSQPPQPLSRHKLSCSPSLCLTIKQRYSYIVSVATPRPNLSQVLELHNVNPEQISFAAGVHVEHVRKVIAGNRPMSKNLALAIKRLTKGVLTTDYLFSLENSQ